PLGDVAVGGADVVAPDRHPAPLVRGLVAVGADRRLPPAVAPAALRALAEEDLASPRAYAPERRGIAPVPDLLPAELREPREAVAEARHVEDRGQCMREHRQTLRVTATERSRDRRATHATPGRDTRRGRRRRARR